MQILIEEDGKTIGRYKSISAFSKRMEILGYHKSYIEDLIADFKKNETYIVNIVS